MGDASDLLKQAHQARRENRLDDAKRALVEAVDLCRNADVRTELAKALCGLGQIDRDLHHVEAARQSYEEAVTIYRADGDALKLAHTVRHLGDIHREDGRPDLAAPCYDEALALYRSHEQTPTLDLANALRGCALLKDATGEKEQAKALWEEARDLYAVVNVKEGVAESSRRLALLAQS
jgi:tetratricopeptide (TPR) repeat protein